MFVEAVVFLSAIIGILLAISSFIFHMITRDQQAGNWKEDIEGAVDAVCDAALEEITKTSKIVLDELDEKYKALLFVYQLMDDKEKGLKDDVAPDVFADNGSFDLGFSHGVEEELDGNIVDDGFSGMDISIGDDIDVIPIEEVEEVEEAEEVEGVGEVEELEKAEEIIDVDIVGLSDMATKKPPRISAHPKYEVIRELLDGGLGVSEIARRLNMGKGEVQLIIGFSGRS